MVVIKKTFCDTCQAECREDGFGNVVGRVTKMNEKLEPIPMMFGGDYCEEHFIKIAEFIGTLKNQ